MISKHAREAAWALVFNNDQTFTSLISIFLFSKAKMAFAGILNDADVTAALQACQGIAKISLSSH